MSEITRQALGRVSQLGGLYDARCDRFLDECLLDKNQDINIFSIDASGTVVTRVYEDSLFEKFLALKVEKEFQTSILCELPLNLSGSGKYLTAHQIDGNISHAAVVLRLRTKHKKLRSVTLNDLKFFQAETLKNCPNATHMVVAIDCGGTCIVEVAYQHGVEMSRKNILSNLGDVMDALTDGAVGNETELKIPSDLSEKIKLNFYVDSLDNIKIPQTLSEAIKFLKNFPDFLQKEDTALTYHLIPLTSLKLDQHQIERIPVYTGVDASALSEIFQAFDYFNKWELKICRLQAQLDAFKKCVPTSFYSKIPEKLSNIENIRHELASSLEESLKNVRSKVQNSKDLLDIIEAKQCLSSKMIDSFIGSFECYLNKIAFLNTVKTTGASFYYVGEDSSVAGLVDRHDLQDYFVFYCNWKTCKPREVESFFKMVKDGKVVIFVDLEVNLEAQKLESDNLICHFAKNVCIDKDVLEKIAKDESASDTTTNSKLNNDAINIWLHLPEQNSFYQVFLAIIHYLNYSTFNEAKNSPRISLATHLIDWQNPEDKLQWKNLSQSTELSIKQCIINDEDDTYVIFLTAVKNQIIRFIMSGTQEKKSAKEFVTKIQSVAPEIQEFDGILLVDYDDVDELLDTVKHLIVQSDQRNLLQRIAVGFQKLIHSVPNPNPPQNLVLAVSQFSVIDTSNFSPEVLSAYKSTWYQFEDMTEQFKLGKCLTSLDNKFSENRCNLDLFPFCIFNAMFGDDIEDMLAAASLELNDQNEMQEIREAIKPQLETKWISAVTSATEMLHRWQKK